MKLIKLQNFKLKGYSEVWVNPAAVGYVTQYETHDPVQIGTFGDSYIEVEAPTIKEVVSMINACKGIEDD